MRLAGRGVEVEVVPDGGLGIWANGVAREIPAGGEDLGGGSRGRSEILG